MYIQITTRCNMSCEHCCYACGSDGEDMSLEVFEAALEQDEIIALGGGEPTLHPLFWQFLGLSIAQCESVWLATNGSQTKTALALAKLARRGVIGCALSQDEYHDDIDDAVVAAFDVPERRGYSVGGNHTDDLREVRDITTSTAGVIAEGRGEDFGGEGCVCEDLFVRPNGDIYACGCIDSPKVGDVQAGVTLPDDWNCGECWKDQVEA